MLIISPSTDYHVRHLVQLLDTLNRDIHVRHNPQLVVTVGGTHLQPQDLGATSESFRLCDPGPV